MNISYSREWQHLLHDSPAKPLLHNLSLLSHGEDDGESKTLLSGKKTAELVAQSRRQHWYSPLNEVDTGSPLASITVKRGVGLDEVGYISNVNSNIVRAILVDLDRQSIVEIFGVVGIYGENTFTTKILANLKFALWDARVDISKRARLTIRSLTSKE